MRPLILSSALGLTLLAGCRSVDVSESPVETPTPYDSGQEEVDSGDPQDTGSPSDTDSPWDTSEPDDTGEVPPEPACDDGLLNGSETDVDCGGDCGPCAVEQSCLDDDDCSDSVCAYQVCSLAARISGTAKAQDAVVGQFAESQRLNRIDYAAPPVVTDFDGSEIALPVSEGRFVSKNLFGTDAGVELRVNGFPMVDATGEVFYQAISPDFFGVPMRFDDSAAALDSLARLEELKLDGQPVEILLIQLPE